MEWLDRTPFPAVLFLALILAIMPLGHSHLVEKLGLLLGGRLVRPLDWFDLVLHASGIVILLMKLIGMGRGAPYR